VGEVQKGPDRQSPVENPSYWAVEEENNKKSCFGNSDFRTREGRKRVKDYHVRGQKASYSSVRGTQKN